MAEQQGLVPTARSVVSGTTCWMCGIRLYPGQMMADGGTACADLRWYCLDVQGCTDRWTSRVPRSADVGQRAAEAVEDAGQEANLPTRPLAGAGMGPALRSQ
jgi:hypothetical protein